MACPTCDHTMESIGMTAGDLMNYWCPRCGTLRITTPGGFDSDQAPKLVERCRRYQETAALMTVDSLLLRRQWISLGIAESINTPGRPT